MVRSRLLIDAQHAVDLVLAERDRAGGLSAKGAIPGRCDDDWITDTQRLAALTEEVGEVARCLNDDRSPKDELVQVAAVALGWIMWELR